MNVTQVTNKCLVSLFCVSISLVVSELVCSYESGLYVVVSEIDGILLPTQRFFIITSYMPF